MVLGLKRDPVDSWKLVKMHEPGPPQDLSADGRAWEPAFYFSLTFSNHRILGYVFYKQDVSPS